MARRFLMTGRPAVDCIAICVSALLCGCGSPSGPVAPAIDGMAEVEYALSRLDDFQISEYEKLMSLDGSEGVRSGTDQSSVAYDKWFRAGFAYTHATGIRPMRSAVVLTSNAVQRASLAGWHDGCDKAAKQLFASQLDSLPISSGDAGEEGQPLRIER